MTIMVIEKRLAFTIQGESRIKLSFMFYCESNMILVIFHNINRDFFFYNKINF